MDALARCERANFDVASEPVGHVAPGGGCASAHIGQDRPNQAAQSASATGGSRTLGRPTLCFQTLAVPLCPIRNGWSCPRANPGADPRGTPPFSPRQQKPPLI